MPSLFTVKCNKTKSSYELLSVEEHHRRKGIARRVGQGDNRSPSDVDTNVQRSTEQGVK